MQLVPYLGFNGTCEEAFKFYAKCLGGKIVAMSRFESAPAEAGMPAGLANLVMHARLLVGDAVLMGSDSPPDRYQPGGGFNVAIQVDTPAEAERIFAALSEGGTVQMPIEETFWATRFGMLIDRFGTPWMINCEKAG